MRRFLILAIVFFIFALTISCEKATSSSEKNKITINTVSMFGGENVSAKVYKDIISEYEEKNNVNVNDKSEGVSEDWKTSVKTSFQIDEEPDVLFYYTGAEAESLIESDKLVDIDMIKSVYPDYAKNISDSAMSFMKESNGKTYAIPVRGFWEGLIVNKDLFDQYNLELPTTWENLIIAIETFSKTDIVPIAVSFSDEPHYWIEHLILSYGGVQEHRKNLEPGVEAPESWAKGLDLLKELDTKEAFADNASETTSKEVKQMFKDKKAAMIVEGSWFSGGIPDQENTTVISFPSYTTEKKQDTDIIGGFSYGFYISKKAWEDPEKRDAVVKFVEEMTSDQSIEKFANAGGAPAATVNELEELSQVQADGVNMASNAKNIEMPIDSRISKNSWEYIISNIPDIISGKENSQEILDNAANLNNKLN